MQHFSKKPKDLHCQCTPLSEKFYFTFCTMRNNGVGLTFSLENISVGIKLKHLLLI